MKSGFLVFAASVAWAGAAFAAQQGSLSTTSSTGSFLLTGTGPTTPRQIQVLNLSDASLTNSTRSDWSATLPGVTMRFCVIDTHGGNVLLTTSSANGPSGSAWVLRTSGGDQVAYRASYTSASDNSTLGELTDGFPSFATTVPGSLTVNGSGACGAGNVKINTYVVSTGGLPEAYPAKVFTDTITIVATPQ